MTREACECAWECPSDPCTCWCHGHEPIETHAAAPQDDIAPEKPSAHSKAATNITRVIHRQIVLHGVQSNGMGGYLIDVGQMNAEVQVSEDGIKIREKARRAVWRSISWAEVWTGATPED